MPLGLFTDENAQALDSLYRGSPFVPTPGLFGGAGTGAALGVGEGAMKTVEPLAGVDMLGALSPSPDFYTPAEPTHEGYSADPRYEASQLVRQFRADPVTVGAAGQLLHGVASLGTRFWLGSQFGGPVSGAVLTGATEGYSQYQAGIETLDDATNKRLAIANGLMAGTMSLLPASIPGKMLVRLGSGATINVGAGALNRFASHQILADAGYAEQASQYRVLDGQAMASDAVLGALFGAVFGHRPAIPMEAVDAAHVAQDAAQAEIDLAPGIPDTPVSRNQHVRQLQDTVTAIMRGEDAPPVERVDTVPNPAQDALREAADSEAALAVRQQGVSLDEPPVRPRDEMLPEGTGPEPPGMSLLGRTARAAEREKAKAEAVAALDPDVQEAIGQAQPILARNDGLQVETLDENGNPVTMDANAALQKAVEDVHAAPEEGVWMQVAAACFGRGP